MELSLISPGDVVVSLCGRDKGGVFAVVEVRDRYVYLANGRKRKIENAKKKQLKHVRPVDGGHVSVTTNKALWRSLDGFRPAG